MPYGWLVGVERAPVDYRPPTYEWFIVAAPEQRAAEELVRRAAQVDQDNPISFSVEPLSAYKLAQLETPPGGVRRYELGMEARSRSGEEM